MDTEKLAAQIQQELDTLATNKGAEGEQFLSEASLLLQDVSSLTQNDKDFFKELSNRWEEKLSSADDASYDIWANGLDALDKIKNRGQIFKQPEVLSYVEKLQQHMQKSGVVGKSNSVVDVVKKVYQELYEANPAYYRIPDTSNAVAQSLISFQNSHKPEDLWHLVTPDYTKANIWVQLKNGDNKDMEATIQDVESFFSTNPPPASLTYRWAGLTYLNVVWQEKMVFGMLESFLSSFAVVFIMMAFLFRSPYWGLLAMIPLSVTIILIYGVIGLIGKQYDMPVAVLSSLSLGLAVDFAIHFLERARSAFKRAGTWKGAVSEMFEEPARAITRNVIVVAVGFTPLLAAPLVPYQTVGIFLASIMAVSGVATMFLLPSFIRLFETILFRKTQK
jgi:hypothetical protein